MLPRRQFAISTDQLWPLVILAALGCLGSLLPVDQVDFWWHLDAGRRIVQTGSIPTTTSQSWALPPATPYIYGSWLAELLLYGLHQLGGLPLIVFVRNLLWLAALGLVGLEARRRARSWRLAALAIAGAGLMALNNLSVRPQMFAWVLFAGTALLVGGFRAGQLRPRLLLLVPLLIGLWANLHGTFALGLALLGLTAAGETLRYVLGQPNRLAPRALLQLWGSAALSGAAALVNPQGVGIVGFVGKLVSDPAVRQFVGEWQPPDLLGFPGIFIPLALVVTLLGWVRHRERFSLTDLVLLLAFGWLAAGAIRNVIWFGLLAWPIAVGALSGLRAAQPRRRATRGAALNWAVAALLLAPLVLVQPPFKSALALGPAFDGMGAAVQDGAYMSAGTPVAAAAWLQANLPPGARLFHAMEYGSYLLWALPEEQVFMDGRIELYPFALWQQYRGIIRGENAVAGLDTLGATHAMLQRSADRTLIDQLEEAPGRWRAVYTDAAVIILERQPGAAQ